MAHVAAPTPFYSMLGKAQWSTDYTNRLPDSAFLVLEAGGKKDDTGRTAPRSLRHLPVYDADGNLDLAHLQNALAQIPKAGPWLTAAARKTLQAKAQVLLERAQATTHKAATGVPPWAIGYLRFLDLHEALGVQRSFAHTVWGAEPMMAKRLFTWVQSFKAAKPGGAPAAPKIVPAAAESALRAKVASHNATHAAPATKAKLSVLKDVWKRGVGSFGGAGRPAVLSKAQWAMERVNAFLHLLGHNAPRITSYASDNDLLPVEHPRSPAFKGAPPLKGTAPLKGAPPLKGTTPTEKDELGEGDLEASGKLAPDGSPTRDYQGVPIVVDRPKGFVQQGNGWSRTYTTDYGYIPSTLGGDGEELDVFLGPDATSSVAYWIVQVRDDGTFDEYKVCLGFSDEAAARRCYLDHIPERYFGSVTSTSVDMFRALLGLEPNELLKAMEGPRTYFCTNARGELVLGHCPPVVFSDAVTAGESAAPAPPAPIALSAAEYEQMGKAVRAVASVLPEGKALRSCTLGKGWKDEVAKATDDGLLVLSPMHPLDVDLDELSTVLAELKAPFLLEYPDTPAARTAFGEHDQAFVLDSAPGRVFVANYDPPLVAGMTMVKAAPVAAEKPGTPETPTKPEAPLAPVPPMPPAPPTAPVPPTKNATKKSASAFTTIGKAAEERYVLGPVLLPNRPDLQGDAYSEEDVRATAHAWMANYQNMGLQHAVAPDQITGFRMNLAGLTNGKIVPLESWLTLEDAEIYGRPIPQGTWMLAARFVDDELWAKVKSGEITGWSIGGFASRMAVAPSASVNIAPI